MHHGSGCGYVVLQFDKGVDHDHRDPGRDACSSFATAPSRFILVAGGSRTRVRWLWRSSACCSSPPAILCFIQPEEDTFAGLADILGFLFFTVGGSGGHPVFHRARVSPRVWWLGADLG
jgi:hypothetical protein